MDLENITTGAVTPAPEQTQSPEVVTPEPEKVEEPLKGEDTPDEKPEDEAQKAIRRMERRINQKHAQAAAAAERARLIEQELEATRQRLSQYEQPQEQQQQPDPYQLAQVIAHKQNIDAKANAVAMDGQKRFADFGDALREVAAEAGPLFDMNRHGLPTALGEAVLESEDPAAVLHYLGKNQDVAAELRGLTPVQLGRRIGRIEAKMSAKQPEPVSKAPPPIKPISATRGTPSLGDMSMDEYVKARAAEGASWARR